MAGTVHHTGYVYVCVDGITYGGHQIAWLIMTGEFPQEEIDHFDTDKGNNRWTNLREATHQQNSINKPIRADNKTGFKGVVKRQEQRFRNRPYVARITVDGRLTALGYYATAEEAGAVYAAAAKQHHGEFARTQ